MAERVSVTTVSQFVHCFAAVKLSVNSLEAEKLEPNIKQVDCTYAELVDLNKESRGETRSSVNPSKVSLNKLT